MRGASRRAVIGVALAGLVSCRLFVDLDDLNSGGPPTQTDSGPPESGGADVLEASTTDTGTDSNVTALEAGPGVVVTAPEGGTNVSVRVEGRYLVVFDQTVGWQPRQWFDLSTPASSTVDIGNAGIGMSEPYQFRETGEPSGHGNAASTSRTISLMEVNGARAAVTAVYLNTTTSATLETRAEYVLWANGRFAETATLKSTAGGSIASFDYLEVAHTNVSNAVPWDITQLASSGFMFKRQAPATSNLLIATYENETAIANDDPASNRFWAVSGAPSPFTLGASLTRSWEWTVWPSTITTTEAFERVAAARSANVAVVSGATSASFARSQTAYVATATGAEPAVLRLAGGIRIFSPCFVIEGWNSPTFRISNGGRVLATSATPLAAEGSASFDAGKKRLVFAANLTIDGAATDAARTFTFEP